MKFMMKVREGFTAEADCDPLGYPYEKNFDLMFEPDSDQNKELSLSMTGYVRHTPFSTRLIIIYRQRNDLNSEKVCRRLIFERKTKAKLKLKDANDDKVSDPGDGVEDDDLTANIFDVELR